jgi:hypothetical protein
MLSSDSLCWIWNQSIIYYGGTIGRRYDRPAVWWSNVYLEKMWNNLVRQWLADLVLGHIKLFSTELFWKKKNPFFTQFLAKFYSNYYFFTYFSFFYNLKKIKSNSLGTIWYAHGLRTPNEGINQRFLKKWADVADKICCRHA